MEGLIYKDVGKISYVCNDGYEGRSCICGEYNKPERRNANHRSAYNKPIHVEG